MQWLQDKKNLPYVLGGVVFLLLVAGVLIAWQSGAFSRQSDATASTSTAASPAAPVQTAPATPAPSSASAPAPVASQNSTAPAPPSVPMTPQEKLAKAMERAKHDPKFAAKLAAYMKAHASGQPLVAGQAQLANDNGPFDPNTVPDPFQLPGVPNHLPKNPGPPEPQLPSIPDPILTTWQPPPPPVTTARPIETTTTAPPGTVRMAGVLFGDGVYAILERNGQSQAVQPGDMVDGGKVIAIEADGLTIKTNDDKLIKVPLSSTPTGQQSETDNGAGNGGNNSLPAAQNQPPAGQFPGGISAADIARFMMH